MPTFVGTAVGILLVVVFGVVLFRSTRKHTREE